MRYIAGDERSQPSLLPPALDDYIGDEALVRVAFVESLDFKALGFTRSEPASTGRPGYDPRDLLRLNIYGYLNEVRSSRRLERECRRNVEVMWLVRRLAPDFKTIADFRRDNGAALAAACRAFVVFCREQGLLAGHLVAIDGSKFRAAASVRRVMGRREINAASLRIDERIAEYLEALEQADLAEADPASTDQIEAALKALRSRRGELDRLREVLENADRATIVEGEPDARPMGIKGWGQKPPSYNVQIAVNPQNSLILHHQVTRETNDERLMHPVAKEAKAVLGVEKLRVVADAGYSSGAQAAACEADGLEPCAPAKRSVNNRGLLDRSAFTYDAASDTYVCPAGRRLLRQRVMKEKHCVRYVAEDCSGCALKPECTTAERRHLKRHLYDDVLQRMDAQIEADPGLIKLRRTCVEHPFGTIKRMTSGGRYLTRGLAKVKGETALSILAYNIMRVANILGARTLAARFA